MITIPEILHRHVNLIGAVNLDSVFALQKRYLHEAEKVDGAAELVAHIQEAVDATQKHIERFTASLVPFEKAALAHDEANRICIRAAALHGAGSDDAKTALKLRDELEIAQQRERIARRKFEEARAGVPSLPETQVVFGSETAKAADIVEKWASISANRIFKRRDGAVDQEVWSKWLDMSSDYVRWIPLFLSREIVRCEELWAKHKNAKPWDRGETHAAEPEDLKKFYKQFLEDRETRRAMKVLEAKRRLAQAEQEATQ
jgi:hypothetical protein